MPNTADFPPHSGTSEARAAPPVSLDHLSGARALVELAAGGGPVRLHLQMLPNELIADIARYLPFDARHSLGQASADMHRALLADLRCDRILLRVDRVATVSTLMRALAEVASLPRARHEVALVRLAQGLRGLHESMAERAIHALLHTIAALAPARRVVPLSRLIRSLGHAPQSARGGDLEPRALALALGVSRPERGPLLVLCLRHLSIGTLRGLSWPRWMKQADALPDGDRAAVLTHLAHVSGFGQSMAQWQPAREQLLEAVRRPHRGMVMAPRHRAEVLRALAEELDCHFEDEEQGENANPAHAGVTGAAGPSSMHDAWHDLFDLALGLPPLEAVPVVGALARCLDGAPPTWAEQGWRRVRDCAAGYEPVDRVALLIVLAQCEMPDALLPGVWQALMTLSERLPDAMQSMVLSQLAGLLMGQAPDAELQARWMALLSRVRKLPPPCRLAPLHGAAGTMGWLHGDAGAMLWPALEAELATLGPDDRAPLLAECARADRLPRGVWDSLFAQARDFPAALQAPLLAALASSGELVCRAPDPARRWLAVFRLTQALGAEQQVEPLMELAFALERLPAGAARGPIALMASAIRALPVHMAARLLGKRALSVNDASTWQWCLADTIALPAVVQAPILSRLACSAARLRLARMPALQLWDSLMAAIEALPRLYRARPLLDMPALVAMLPRGAQRDAQAQIAAELARTPEADWPAWFDGHGERAPKRARRGPEGAL